MTYRMEEERAGGKEIIGKRKFRKWCRDEGRRLDRRAEGLRVS